MSPNVVGGLRARFIRDSAFEMIRDSLDALGWFDSGREHREVTALPTPLSNDQEIQLNTFAVSQADVVSGYIELGSNYEEDRWTFYVDWFAEDEAVGIHLIHDVRDILRGKMPSIGRTLPVLEVFDYTLATPVVTFVCQIEDVEVDRAVEFSRPYQKFWYVAKFDVVDTYGDENDQSGYSYEDEPGTYGDY